MLGVYKRISGIETLAKFPWKIGIVGFMAFPETLKGENIVERFKTLAEDGFFDLLEFPPFPDDIWPEIERITEETHIEIAAALQPVVLSGKANPSALDEKQRCESMTLLKKTINEIAEKGINKAALCSGPYPGEEKLAAAKEALVKSLIELGGYAEEKGVTLYLETFDTKWDKKQALGPLNDAAEVIRKVRKQVDNVWLLWDLSHAPLLGEKPEDLESVKDVLGHVHIGCAKKAGDAMLDSHPGFYTPGSINGVEEVARLLVTLKKIGYEGAISFEVKPEPQESSLQVINAAKGVLYTAFLKTI